MAEVIKQCPMCRRDFPTKRAKAIYCSRKCMGEYGRQRRAELRLTGQGNLRTTIHYAVDGLKKCRDCAETKPVTDFPKRAGLDGYRPYCKECKKARHDAWLEANRDAVNAQRKAFYEANRDRINKTRAADYIARRDELLAAKRADYQKNPERYRTRSRSRRSEHPAENYFYAKRWRERNPGKARIQAHRRRAREVNAAIVPFTAQQLRQRWEVFGGRCYICGEAASATDHVKPLACGGPEILSNLRPICRRCNSAKRGDWLGIALYEELITWVRSNSGPLPDEYRRIARAHLRTS